MAPNGRPATRSSSQARSLTRTFPVGWQPPIYSFSPPSPEGSCNAVIEAMACGRAIVASDIPSIRQLTGNEAARLVDPSDIASISAAIGDLAAHDEAREEFARRALRRSGLFSLEARAKKILDWLVDLRSHRETGDSC